MPVVDLYLPDDLPLGADAELGQALARVVDVVTGPGAAPCTVFVHRLPVFAVVSADTEGLRTVRIHLVSERGPWLDLGPRLYEMTRAYLGSADQSCSTRVVVSIQAVTESYPESWPDQDVHDLAV